MEGLEKVDPGLFAGNGMVPPGENPQSQMSDELTLSDGTLLLSIYLVMFLKEDISIHSQVGETAAYLKVVSFTQKNSDPGLS